MNTNTTTEMQFTGVKLPVRLHTKLEAIAHREGNTISSVMRRLLTVAVEKERQDGED